METEQIRGNIDATEILLSVIHRHFLQGLFSFAHCVHS